MLEANEKFDGSIQYTKLSSPNNKKYTFTTGLNDKYLYIQGPNVEDMNIIPFIQVAAGEIDDFTTSEYDTYYGKFNNSIKISTPSTSISNKKSPIIIKPISKTQFELNILDESSDSYIIHSFKKIHYEDDFIISNSVTKIITCDVWCAEYLKDADGNNIMQGNTNFIFSLAEPINAQGHVGAGHGNCVALWNLFFADGRQFDPETLSQPVECSVFRFTEKVNHYLRDASISPSSEHSYPQLDINGEPIIAATQYLDGEWSINNFIKMRNKLTIKYNGLKFEQVHGAMCCGFYPYFDNLIINDDDNTWNKIIFDGETFSRVPMGNSIKTLPSMSYTVGDEVILFGSKYRVTQRLYQNNGARTNKSNLLNWIPPSHNNRLKVYLMPAITTSSQENIQNGQEVEVFNIGDVLDINTTRKLDILI